MSGIVMLNLKEGGTFKLTYPPPDLSFAPRRIGISSYYEPYLEGIGAVSRRKSASDRKLISQFKKNEAARRKAEAERIRRERIEKSQRLRTETLLAKRKKEQEKTIRKLEKPYQKRVYDLARAEARRRLQQMKHEARMARLQEKYGKKESKISAKLPTPDTGGSSVELPSIDVSQKERVAAAEAESKTEYGAEVPFTEPPVSPQDRTPGPSAPIGPTIITPMPGPGIPEESAEVYAEESVPYDTSELIDSKDYEGTDSTELIFGQEDGAETVPEDFFSGPDVIMQTESNGEVGIEENAHVKALENNIKNEPNEPIEGIGQVAEFSGVAKAVAIIGISALLAWLMIGGKND